MTGRPAVRGVAWHVVAAALVTAGGLEVRASPQPSPGCQPVAGTTLEQFYPVMPGWTRGTPTSETDALEKVSRTTVDFDRDVATIAVELMDSCRNPDLLRLIREALKQFPPGGRGTTQRHTTVNGFPAYEEYTAESSHGEIHVLVADRFMVVVTGDTIDLTSVQNAARLVPMPKLATQK